jgi:hypothetical protein
MSRVLFVDFQEDKEITEEEWRAWEDSQFDSIEESYEDCESTDEEEGDS